MTIVAEHVSIDALRAQLRSEVNLAARVVPTHYPLETFIAVNPLAGLEGMPFEQAVLRAGDLYGVAGLLDETAYRDLYHRGRITDADSNRHCGCVIPPCWTEVPSSWVPGASHPPSCCATTCSTAASWPSRCAATRCAVSNSHRRWPKRLTLKPPNGVRHSSDHPRRVGRCPRVNEASFTPGGLWPPAITN